MMKGDDSLKRIIKSSFLFTLVFLVLEFYSVQAQEIKTINLEPTMSNEEYNEDFNISTKPNSIILDVPIIEQRPELPTGCEITAVAMMLNYCVCDIDKIQLTREMPYHKSNPNLGYVGNPFLKSGWTVYPPPLCELVKKYAGSVVDLTGASLETIENQLAKNKPVVAWVSMHRFTVHAITVSGYDSGKFYYNDPWTGDKNKAINKKKFEDIWKSQNKRALSY